MAGSFGYEKEHYEMSMAIFRDRLLPAIEQAPAGALFVADGLSCRSQIHHGTNKRALHLAELVHQCLK